MEFICYKNCSTCKDVEKQLKEKGFEYSKRSIVDDTPTADELKAWYQQAELPITRWLNTSGQKYRELGLSTKRKEMSDSELLETISTDGMLIKRPIIINEDKIFVGKDAVEYVAGL